MARVRGGRRPAELRRSAARACGAHRRPLTRAVAALEQRLGARLLNRTTRSVSVTSEGERFSSAGGGCLPSSTRSSRPPSDRPARWPARVTAPVLFGQLHVAPLVLRLPRATPRARRPAAARRPRGIARRGGHRPRHAHRPLPDSSLRARQVGQVRWVVCASPAYLARAGAPRTPEALARHACISFDAGSPFADHWTFPRPGGRDRAASPCGRASSSTPPRRASTPRSLGWALVRVLSYQVDQLLAGKKLRLVLETFAPARADPPGAVARRAQPPRLERSSTSPPSACARGSASASALTGDEAREPGDVGGRDAVPGSASPRWGRRGACSPRSPPRSRSNQAGVGTRPRAGVGRQHHEARISGPTCSTRPDVVARLVGGLGVNVGDGGRESRRWRRRRGRRTSRWRRPGRRTPAAA